VSLLRPGKRPSGEEVEQILRHVIGRIRRNWPAVEIMVRGDSHFATPEVMDLLEKKRCGYIFGLSTNPRLTEIGRPWSEDVATRRALSKKAKDAALLPDQLCCGLLEQAPQGRRPRRGERARQRHTLHRHQPARPAKVLYEKVYCARGRMGNLIKDMNRYAPQD
jgi:hypothetical protein